MKKIVLAILTALMALGILSSTATADVVIPKETTVTVTETEHKEAHIQGRSFIRFRVGVYTEAEGLSKEEMANAEECRWVGEGTDVPTWTNSEGHQGEAGFRKWLTHERAYVCEIDGQWYKALCGNEAWLEEQANVPEIPVLLVKNYTKKKIRIHIPIPFVLKANCGTMHAKVKIDQLVSLKAFARSKGKAKYVKVDLKGKILDKVKGMIHGGITCSHTTTTTEKETVGTPPPSHEEKPPCTTCHEPPPCNPCHEEEKEPPCECTPPPPCGEVEFFGEYEFEEAYVNEGPIQYWKYINAPKGDQLTVYFETEHGSFSPEYVQVASFGAETTKFQSYWTAPSHPGHYAVWVRVVDHTCEKTYESAKQFVTVKEDELSEPPR